jgi:hypothetical protein
MARKTAEEISDQIAELTEVMNKRNRQESRDEVADTFLDMIKNNPGDLLVYLTSGPEDIELSDGRKLTVQNKSYLPGVNPNEFMITPDFLAGIRFMCNALKDADLEL